MKKFKFLSIIITILIIVVMIFLSSCSTPSESSSSSQGDKSEASNQASINELMLGVGPGSKVVQVAAGYHDSMAIVRDSKGKQTLWVIGSNADGQLGLGDIKDRSKWVNAGLTNVSLVACGNYYSLCVANNYLYVTGDNSKGQLGLGYTGGSLNKWTQLGYGNIYALACGGDIGNIKNTFYSMFISKGQLWETGDNSYGQLGLNPASYPNLCQWTPIRTNYVTQVACGYAHSIYIGDDGSSLYVTGANDSGQLGLGYKGNPVTQWTKVTNINSSYFTGVGCGRWHSVISAYGPYNGNYNYWIWVTGNSSMGQLGLGYSTQISSWTQLGYGNIDYNSVTCTDYDSYFTSGRGLWVTGDNGLGELGIGSTNKQMWWISNGYGNIQGKVSAGAFHALFISQNNTWGAGNNLYHELGVPSLNNSYWPWFVKN